MEKAQQNTVKDLDEISMRELITKLRDWWKFLLSKWIMLLISGVVGAVIGLIISVTREPDYEGELTFVMEDSKSNPLGAYVGLASQFGIDLGSGSGSGVFEGDNIIQFLKSRMMIEQVLLSATEVDGKAISLADLYINSYHMREKWQKKPWLSEVHFPITDDRKKFTRLQDSVLNVLQTEILKRRLTVEKIDKKLNFIRVNCISASEQFSKVFTENLASKAITFYIDTKTRRNKINIDRLQSQADSIESLLNRKTYSAAVIEDLNLNPAKQAAGVNSEVAKRDKFMLQTMYAEVIKNLELSKIAMAQETPVMQIVDKPIFPLKKNELGKVKGVVLGALIVGVLVALSLLGRKILREIMEAD